MQLSRGARRLLETLRWWLGRFGAIFPGQRKLAAALGVKATRTIQRWLAELAEAGLVTWKRRGYRRTNLYQLSETCTPKCRINVASVVTRSLNIQRRQESTPLVLFVRTVQRFFAKKEPKPREGLYDRLKRQRYPGFV